MINPFKFNLAQEKRGAKNTNNLISFVSFRRVKCNGFNLKDDFMKSLLKNLLLLSMGLMIYSCNEKISPELLNGNSTTVPTAIVPTDYYFKVENTSATILNHKLHRTGPNKQASNCEITSNSITNGALSSENFSNENISTPASTNWDSKKFDISCFFEAEELSLYYSGFKFKVSASPNTCAHVGYAPFSFYDKIAGSSSTTYTYVNCDAAVIGSASTVAAGAIPGNGTVYTGGAQLDCGEYGDQNVPAASRAMRDFESEEELCSFNYQDKKCDEGIITIKDIDVKWVPEVTLPVPAAAHAEATAGATRILDCGGNHLNCVEGPMKKLSYIYAASSTELNPTTYNEAFSKEYSYAGSYPARRSNKQYANFRRNLANPNIDFVDSDQTLGAAYSNPSTGYVSKFGGAAPETSFQPLLMDLYSYNLRWDAATEVLSPATRAAQSISAGYTAIPFAAEPFLGFEDYRVNPFYTFYCFDEAYEIKGRIRMVVREWDRVYPTATTSLSYISDIGSLTSSRQDYAFGQTTENPGDPDGYNAYNDLKDWDDFLFMKRQLGGVTGSTLWEPSSGFFNSGIFTEGGL
jgi:hypothetical protein